MSATSRFTTTSTAPTSAIFRRTSARSQSHWPSRADVSAGTPALTASTAWLIASSPIPDPRIEREIREVDQQVHDRVGDGDQQHDALDHRIVAAQHRRDDEAAEAWDVEHGLDHDRAADQNGEGDPDHGERGDDRVLQRVLVHD